MKKNTRAGRVNVPKHILPQCQPPLSVPNVKTMLTTERVVHMNSMGFLFIVSRSTNTLVVFAAALSWKESETYNEGSSTSSVVSTVSQVREYVTLSQTSALL